MTGMLVGSGHHGPFPRRLRLLLLMAVMRSAGELTGCLTGRATAA